MRRLKTKCLRLAHEFSGERSVDSLTEGVETHIRLNVESELSDLFRLNQQAASQFIEEIMSDQKVWGALLTSAAALAGVAPAVAAGAGLYALSKVGSQAVRTHSSRRERLAASDYILLYRMG